MLEVKNLRTEEKNNWVYLKCDIEVTDIENPFEEKSLWIAIEKKNEDMLSTKVYDPFVLVPLMLGMYYGQDVHICGNVSPRLYHNVQHYLIKIFNNFSDFNKIVDFKVDGFDTVEKGYNTLIGTGISCGVDSMLTLYNNYIKEDDINFKVNSLFFVNSGTHGDFENPETNTIWLDRANLNKEAADELGLPMYLINSNFHAFTHKIGEQKIGYLAIYSCVLSLQKYIKRYLTSGNLSYDEIAKFSKQSRDFDIAEYSENYMPHLISTENFELVIDGCQYTRAEKTEVISDWKFANKHLNVCLTPINKGRNCSMCEKCMWTLIPLEAMGKLDNFKDVFDKDVYYKASSYYKRKFLAYENKDAMRTSVINYAKSKEMKLPSKFLSVLEWKIRGIIKKK